jgi:hypothetical protein
VRIQYGYAGKQVRDIFAQATPRGRVPVRSNGMDTNDDGEIDLYSHMKNLIVSGNYGKHSSSRFVVTGSSNYQDTGLRGDEMIVRMFGASATRQYMAQWKWMWLNHTRAVVYSADATVPGGEVGRVAATPTIIEPYGTDSPQWRNE